MIDTKKDYYLDLELGLYSLRNHFHYFKGGDNKEILDWAKFFLVWSRKAADHCGPWGLENLKAAESFAKNLEKSKVGVMGYEVLENMMAEASASLNCEILDSLRKEARPAAVR